MELYRITRENTELPGHGDLHGNDVLIDAETGDVKLTDPIGIGSVEARNDFIRKRDLERFEDRIASVYSWNTWLDRDQIQEEAERRYVESLVEEKYAQPTV